MALLKGSVGRDDCAGGYSAEVTNAEEKYSNKTQTKDWNREKHRKVSKKKTKSQGIQGTLTPNRCQRRRTGGKLTLKRNEKGRCAKKRGIGAGDFCKMTCTRCKRRLRGRESSGVEENGNKVTKKGKKSQEKRTALQRDHLEQDRCPSTTKIMAFCYRTAVKVRGVRELSETGGGGRLDRVGLQLTVELPRFLDMWKKTVTAVGGNKNCL